MKFVPGGPPRYRHQRQALKKMIDTGGVTALLMEPGLGKTYAALDYACLLALKSPHDPREARVLVICPLAAMDTWVLQAREGVSPQVAFWAEALGGSLTARAEALTARGPGGALRRYKRRKNEAPRAHNVRLSWAWDARRLDGAPLGRAAGPAALDEPRVVIEVMNFDSFSSRATRGSRTMADVMLAAVRRYDPDLVIIDESHKIKSASSNVSMLAARIGASVPRRLILTGTVMPQGPMDVFGQWRFLDPMAFGHLKRDGTKMPMSYSRFRDSYAVTGGWMGRQVVGFKNLEEMQEVMARRAIVVRKQDALDLPEVTDTVVPVHLSAAEARVYAEMKKSLATTLAGGQQVFAGNRLSQLMRLRQITSGHLPDDQGTKHRIGDSKVRTITSLVNDTLAGEQRVVIFCLFTAEIADLAASLRTGGTTVEVIEGGVSGEERRAIRQRFGDTTAHPERIVLVAQIKTISLAVNELVTASHAVFGSMSQQRDDIVQARDRLNRIGQKRAMTFWYALAPGTVDEVIYRAYQTRSDLETAMLAHIQEPEPEPGLESP